ncbi:alpha/beta fold hydrolase [Georgenia sp. Z1491]|uniref:alpha/beta fold hydrolase n=1 Tax=Georgenia sp. Z1491 TaxID=3416707 RepID=UPI003CEF6845
MSAPTVTATRLTPGTEAPPGADVLVVGAGLGTGVQALWAGCAAELADRFVVVGWDMPGHGSSPARDEPTSVADLADALAALVGDLRESGVATEGARIAYAGVSLGGAVALQLALDHPRLFDGIAVVCSAARIGEPDAWRERAAFVAASGTPSQVTGSAERWFAPGFIERHPDRAAALLHTLQDADRHAYARLCEALAEFDVRDRLGEVATPLLTVHGADDAVCPPPRGEEIVGAVQAGTAVVLEGVAHQAPAEDPVGTARALAAHLLP